MKAIERKAIELSKREQIIRSQLKRDEQVVKKKALKVGKIALVSGVIALIVFWGYQTFSTTSIDEKEKKSSNKKKSAFGHMLNRITKLASPYLAQFLSALLEIDEDKESSKR